jgi:hypothetical protein
VKRTLVVLSAIAAVGSPALAVSPDQAERMFPIYVPGGLPEYCALPKEDERHTTRVEGLLDPNSDGQLVSDPTEFKPFQQMLCSSAVLQYHYARRERRSQHFASVLDAATYATAAGAAGLGAFGAPARAILGVGLAGGVIAVGRGYKSPEARQIIYHKGEAALQCMDRSVRALDPIYAHSDLRKSDSSVVRLFETAGQEAQLDDIEAAARVVAGLQGADAELTALQTASTQVLAVLKGLRAGPSDLVAGYETIGQTVLTRYQDTRAPLDFGKAIDLIKQDVSTAQGQKADAKAASAAISQGSAVTALSIAADPAKAAENASWKTELASQLRSAVPDGTIADDEDLRYYFLRLLSSKYDPVRGLGADITVCETMVAS